MARFLSVRTPQFQAICTGRCNQGRSGLAISFELSAIRLLSELILLGRNACLGEY